MLGNIIFIIFLIILVYKLQKNTNTAIVSYIVFSLICPHLKVANLQISFEIIAFFPVLIIFILKKPSIFSLHRRDLYRQHLIIYFYIFLASSFIATLRFESKIPWISFLSVFRIICLIYIMQSEMEGNSVQVLDRIISPVLFTNLAVSIIQLTVPVSTKIFYELYYKASLTPLAAVLKLGFFNRAYGTFATPVLLGIFSIISFAIYLGFLTEKRQCKRLYLKLVISVIIGLLALSKTAVIGIPIISICYCILILFDVIKIKNKKIAIIPLILIPIFGITVILLEKHGTAISYYIGFLSKPFEALSTRYNSSSGLLSGTFSTIYDNWLIGVGGTPIGDDFTGDSLYISILYSTGILGLITYFSILIGSTVKNLKLRNTTALLCFIAFCLAGLAAPIGLDIVTMPVIAYMFCKSETTIS
ncbi:hypothetical protein [Ruminiclostridium cellobioparum]|uniref:hypothetical protein n=1 Tax=Ruminiclostridium cellobioparum TaxID=29355 RepID=UPI00047FA5FB|nr:hypothetical protein [Ruminiclostridium cellobioparum]